jgi:hypothetical protein
MDSWRIGHRNDRNPGCRQRSPRRRKLGSNAFGLAGGSCRDFDQQVE